MNEPLPTTSPSGSPARRWRPLNSTQRRVLGVLGEKAKTTPDVYPMSLNGVVTGCNQKSNRSPLLSLEAEQVEEALDKLREFGAVTLVEGSGRVQKYKHHLYEWLGVDKVEMAVMIELLLRGPQTLGELRGRASRMEPIGDLNELRELLNSLREKGLILPLTPDGRGQIFTHALFQQRDLDEQRSQFANVLPASYEQDDRAATATFSSPAARTTNPANTTTTAASSSSNDSRLEKELGELRMQATQLQADLNDLTSRHEQLEAEVSRLRDALGG